MTELQEPTVAQLTPVEALWDNPDRPVIESELADAEGRIAFKLETYPGPGGGEWVPVVVVLSQDELRSVFARPERLTVGDVRRVTRFRYAGFGPDADLKALVLEQLKLEADGRGRRGYRREWRSARTRTLVGQLSVTPGTATLDGSSLHEEIADALGFERDEQGGFVGSAKVTVAVTVEPE